MRNKITDLNDYLFEQMERLNDDSLTPEELEIQIKRSDEIQKIARTIIDNGRLALDVKKHLDEYGVGQSVDIPLLGVRGDEIEKENKELKETVSNLTKRLKKTEQW